MHARRRRAVALALFSCALIVAAPTAVALTSGVGSRGLRYPDARDAGKPARE